jgi:hypothetical protein
MCASNNQGSSWVCFAAFACFLNLVVVFVSAPAEEPVRAAVAARSDNDNVQQLVRDVVWNEIHSQTNDHTYWRYHEVKEENGIPRLLDVIQTRYGEIYRVLAMNDQPLTGKQLEAEDNRIRRLLSHPDQIEAEKKKREEDANEERRLLESLPNAFLFREEGGEGSVVKLSFRPNPAFRPTTHEAEVFHHMEGTMLVDARAKRLVEIEGRLTSKVKFAGGLLGHLNEGGTFRVLQRNVGRGHWDMLLLEVHMDGKALFFKTIAVRQKEVYSDYRQVPENVTLQQAAQLLKQDATTSARVPGD